MASHLSLLLLIFSRLSVAYRVSVKTGGSTTIPCRYDLKYKTHVKYWCKEDNLYRCSPYIRTDIPKSTAKALISDDINQQTFTLNMTDLEPEDSGRYWCVVEINGGSDVGIEQFNLSVNSAAEPVQTDNTVQGPEGGKKVTMSSIDLNVLLIPLGMLVVVIAGVPVTWKMWRKYKDNKAMDQTTNTSVDPFPANGDDVTYSTVVPKRRNQLNVQTKAEPDDNVVYSSLTLQLDPFPANGDDVTYSTVVPKRRNQLNVQTKTEPDDHVVYSSLVPHRSRGQQHSSD
ncbi:CMRF35-like molecule 5 isoform X2 [Oncorhynchus clarkii lewisi]|uniref:CMRF35-like molecule 5 isoform X2 n=1 Tax=Oncorhynchus clarkii lewisi TaxID=490388 RepID=UPI0039B94BE7